MPNSKGESHIFSLTFTGHEKTSEIAGRISQAKIARFIQSCTETKHATFDMPLFVHQPLLVASCADSVMWWRQHPDSSIHYIYRVDDAVVGAILVKEYWNLSNLFVDPAYHHQGIARKLISKALEDLCLNAIHDSCSPLSISPFTHI